MSTTKLKTASSLSGDSTQVRYQKALKEINKLIGVNTQLRQNNQKNEQMIIQLDEKCKILQLEKQNFQKDKALLQDQLNQLISQKVLMVKQNQQLKKQMSKLRGLRTSVSSQIRKLQSKQSNADSTKGDEAVKMLEKTLQIRNQTIAQLLVRLKKLQENNRDNKDNKDNRDNRLIINDIKADIYNSQLNKKLQIANQYIQKVNAQNVDLKSKLVRAQSNRLITARSVQVLPKYTPQISPRYNGQYESRNSEQVLKRYHKLQEQNKRLLKKYESNKTQINQLNDQNKKLKKQNKKQSAQIAGFEALITKQQQIISQLHIQYDKQVIRMTDQFKQKLLDQRESFSPAKSADQLKQIQNLQAQNKALRKKFQLCSLELTKCFKTLEVYRVKLSQCEKDYGELINQRQQLNEKLNRLQASYKQKSSYSKSSNSKVPVDNQRRNSMGETGCFNYI